MTEMSQIKITGGRTAAISSHLSRCEELGKEDKQDADEDLGGALLSSRDLRCVTRFERARQANERDAYHNAEEREPLVTVQMA